jgi:anti-sigma B factor antagonist
VAFDDDATHRDMRATLTATPQLELRHEDGGAHHTLVLIGELDVASAPLLEAALRRIGTNAAETITLDLSGLTFMDSAGLRVVLVARELCDGLGCELQLVPGSGQIQRLFEVTGLLDQLPFRG